uniref:Pregnancy-specific beta 1-glycoprotein n=1 Tax=Rattus norvegicus TaxID=10116 RepID=Q9Z1D6_RAT|nr:pregnancy-specific beta 1-glycoprotein [Rattus norvegicus]|eukprot:NP_067709.1 pregnancy-specific beta 1-glycoprotein [Rattus norvegicus]
MYSARETLYRNGSMLIHNVTQKDTGFYRLRIFNRHRDTMLTSTFLHVNLFLWNCGHLVASGRPSIETLPPIVQDGKDVVLQVRNLPENLLGFAWFKGMTQATTHLIGRYIIEENPSFSFGPASSGREKLYTDGSLLIENVTQKDAGLYTLGILGTDMKSQEAHGEIQVESLVFQCCNSLTPAKILVEPVPRHAAEGESVLLLVHYLPKELISFTWYNSMYTVPTFKIVNHHVIGNITTWGDAYRGRGMLYVSGSLLLQDITKEDARMYTLETLNINNKVEKAHVQFYVNEPVTQPFIRVANITVKGSRSVTFSCVSPHTGISIHWFFNNHNLKFTDRTKLSPSKCGLRIDDVRREDAGEYKCEVINRAGKGVVSQPVRWP